MRALLLTDHPITRAAQITVLVRLAALVLHFFGRDPDGTAISAAPLVMLPFALAYHLGAIWLLMGAWLVVWRFAGRGRRAVEWAAAASFAAILLLAQSDLTLHRLTGNSLTWSIVRAYFGPDLLTTDVAAPLSTDLVHTLLSAGLVAGGAWQIWRATRRRHGALTATIRWREPALWVVVAIVAIWWRRSGAFLNQSYGLPVEARLVAGALGWGSARPPANEAAMRDAIRAQVRLRPGQGWLSDSFPLLRGPVGAAPTPAASAPSAPDIVVIAIEALRGADLGYLKPVVDTSSASGTPNLSRLALRSVVFPAYIANGTTSPTGFFSINCSAWRHPSRETLGDFSPRSFDCLSARLRDLGYRTMYLNASNPGFDRQLDWARPLFDILDFEPPTRGIYNDNITEELLVEKFLTQLARHDSTSPARPVYAYLATHSTHPPYILDAPANDLPAYLNPGATGITPRTIPDAHQRYLAILKYTDAQVARILDALRRRPRAEQTIVIVVGDHSVSLTEPDPAAQMPYDMYTWTGAIIAGPPALIGPPRRDTLPASHVDLSETLLRLVGDQRPTASLGNDLLIQPRPLASSAVSFYPTGFRFDRNGCSLFVGAESAARFWSQRSFRLGEPAVLADPTCPFAADDARRLRDLANYWAWLVESDRVWSPSFLNRKTSAGQ